MKQIVKFIFLLALTGLLIVKPIESRAAYTSTNDAYTLVNYLNGQVGNDYTANRCQAFVYNSLVNSLGVYGAKACAYEAWLAFGVSTDRNIPLGAAVYFSGGSYPCGDHIAGHVGLYVGDGYVVHVAQAKVQKTLLSSIESWSGYSYLGWGWQGGYALANYVPDYTEPPTNVSISANKSLYAAGETVTFTCAGTNVSGYTIGIDRDGTRIFTGEISSVYETSFAVAGTYSAYVTAWNTVGSVDSDSVSFTVYNTVPTNVYLSTNKSKYSTGETVTFTCSGTNVCGYTIGIDRDNTRIFTGDINAVHETFFANSGAYTAYITAWNALGSVDSARIYFDVYAGAPYGPWIVADKNLVNVGEAISFTFNASDASSFGLGIDKVGAGRVSSPNVGEATTYTASFAEVGTYSAYATCYNSFGGCDSAPITFIVYDSAPTYGKVECDKSVVNVGEEVVFKCTSDYARGYAIGIYKDGIRVFSSDINTVLNKSFSEPGTYTAYISVWNEYGIIDSPHISFEVYNSQPTYCDLKTDKMVVNIGEEITFSCDSDVGRGYGIGIYKNGSHIFGSDIGKEFKKSFTEAGKYTADIATWNEYGIINSSVITFYVVDPSKVLSTHSVVTKSGDTIQVSTKLAGQHNNAMIFAAAFKEDVLTAVESYRVIETEREKVFYLSPKKDSEVVKIYLWDPENLTPIGDPEIIPKSAWSEAEE